MGKRERRHGPDDRRDRKWYHEWGWETAGLFGAELASMAVSVGAFTFMGEVAPNLINDVSKVGAKVVEPFLDTIEWGLQKGCKLKECQPDFSKSREERAQQYARYLTLFSVSLVAGIGTEMGVRIFLNERFHVKGRPNDSLKKKLKEWTPTFLHGELPTWHDLAVVTVDRGTQLGAIIGVNTLGADKADNVIENISSFAQKTFHWPKERADKFAQMLVVYEGPNWFGFGMAAGYIGHSHYRDAHRK